MRASLSVRALAAGAILWTLPAAAQTEDKVKQGHSRHGDAFDIGPRQKPWVIEGIGRTHFPITTRNPEVQRWFDQGNTLLHHFWYYEAERAFRWCLKLEPENAMAYWGLARAAQDNDRTKKFLEEAIKRKSKVSERERLYIEAWQWRYQDDPLAEGGGERRRKFQETLEKIAIKYPNDVEAAALLAYDSLGQNRYANDVMLKKVLAAAPQHPGAHHYRIHLWDDGPNAAHALDSCTAYNKVATGVGHGLHMPGHIYGQLGMWHEAAIAMDSAARVEAGYLRKRMKFPFNSWNYAHNRDYLGYLQEQLGMPGLAIAGARELLDGPAQAKDAEPNKGPLARVLVKYERWKELLDEKSFGWRDTLGDKVLRHYVEALAHIGLGNLDKAARSMAAHTALATEVRKPENSWRDRVYTANDLELKGRLALARGQTLNGIAFLGEAARKSQGIYDEHGDPPEYPHIMWTVLGRAYLEARSPALAVTAFEKSLEISRNDGFALAGLVEAHAAVGDKPRATLAMARLLHVWSDAEPGNRWLERARATGVTATARDLSPNPQRNYKKVTLASFGPAAWQPYPAPTLDALDASGKRVTLPEYRGKNLLLIFYLGDECPHCLDQLKGVSKRKADFSRLNTEVLAISSDAPEENAGSGEVKDLGFRLLSDKDFANARRFQSYDDFENLELHSTILIDAQGRVHWARNGGDPFTDFDFLIKEITRLNQRRPPAASPPPTATAAAAPQP
jgi:peroxiredoxin/tetratricopeptide (TPR) repeat protein